MVVFGRPPANILLTCGEAYMRCVVALLASALMIVPAWTQGALMPGKPASIHEAVSKSNELLVFAAAGLAAAGLGVLLIGHGSSSSATSTTP